MTRTEMLSLLVALVSMSMMVGYALGVLVMWQNRLGGALVLRKQKEKP